tara:strand:- start:165 stop:1118 length:954 start_codon:yes stop_codon:yes gene_type:complete
MILTRTPYRISLSGGGTDLPKFFNKKFCYGSIISFSINKYIYISVNYLAEKKIILKYSKTEVIFDVKNIKHKLIKKVLQFFKIKHGVEIHSIGEFSGHGTGLGSSSAFLIGLINAISNFKNIKLSKKQIYEIAIKIELSIYPNVGIQDHLACTFGSFNYWKIQTNKISRVKINNKKILKNINNIFIVNTHIKRSANTIIKNYKFNLAMREKLKKSAYDTDQLYKNLRRKEIYLPKAINNSWILKKKLNSKVTTVKIEKIIKLGIESGAMASKLLGAGGGGFILFYVKNSLRKIFEKKMIKFKPIKVNIDHYGTKRLI